MTADTPSPSEVVEMLKPIIRRTRQTFIRETAPTATGRRQYTADIDQAIADDVVRALELSSPRSSTVDDLAEKIGRALANDPVCGGRVCQDTVDYIASLVALATVDEATVGWQPIETAPKDGRLILLATGGWVGEGRYFNDACRWFEMNADPSDAWDGEIYQPTHWRPLPEPPASLPSVAVQPIGERE